MKNTEVDVEEVNKSIEDQEEEYWCGKCSWRGTFDQTILLETRGLGCPECGSVVFEV